MTATTKHAVLTGTLVYLWFHVFVVVLDFLIGQFVCAGILAAITVAIYCGRQYLKEIL